MPDDVATDRGDDEGPAAPVRLAELVAARICHDLASPVGAIGNGAELMRELGGGEAEDVELIASSSARTSALLGLHRLAFGPQPAGAKPLERTGLAARLEPAFAAGRAALRVEPLEGPALPAPAARLAALMGLAGRGLAGLRAEVALSLAPDGALPVTLAVAGSGVGWTPEQEALVRGHAAPETARQIEFALLPLAARAAGATLWITTGPNRAGLEATPA